jgi:hypothetical protein
MYLNIRPRISPISEYFANWISSSKWRLLGRVKVLLEKFDAEKVVITADHGEAFGEWGFHSHNTACPHHSVRRVPWVETTANDEDTFGPTIEPPQTELHIRADVEKRLVQLGYR